MWHPFLFSFCFSVSSRGVPFTRPGDASPGCATDNQRAPVVGETIKKRDR